MDWILIPALVFMVYHKEILTFFIAAKKSSLLTKSDKPAEGGGSCGKNQGKPWRLEVFDDSDGTFRYIEIDSPCWSRGKAEEAARGKLILSWRLGKREAFLLVAPDGKKYLYRLEFVPGDTLNSLTEWRRCLICDKEMVEIARRDFYGGAGSGKEVDEICSTCRDSVVGL